MVYIEFVDNKVVIKRQEFICIRVFMKVYVQVKMSE